MQRTPWFRWYILRTLLGKEISRHLANRGGIALVFLLLVAAFLLSIFGKKDDQSASFLGGVQRCYIDYQVHDAWVAHLENNLDPELAERVRFRSLDSAPRKRDGTIVYVQNTGAIQIRQHPSGGYLVWVWHPGKDGSALAVYEKWFWKETGRFREIQASSALLAEARAKLPDFQVQERRDELKGGLDPRSGLATSLVTFGMFFVCIYLLPSLACEERERGVLLAQALSPAAPREILAARFLFYPLLGVALAAALAGIYNPAALLKPFFWLVLLVGVCGCMGIGMTIASLARTQREASLGAMGYIFIVALFLYICQQVGIRGLPLLALEYHCPRLIHAVLGDAVLWYHWGNLAAAAGLALAWAVLATWLFRRCGWQT